MNATRPPPLTVFRSPGFDRTSVISPKYYAGVEGGATNTTVCLLNENGDVLSVQLGAATNQWLEGMETVADRIVELIFAAKKDCNIPLDHPLVSVGCSLSGFGQEPSRFELAKILFEKKQKALCATLSIMTDAVGPVFSMSPKGGIVIISGTGSFAQSCGSGGFPSEDSGGWGHMIGDEGSATYIALKALKYIFQLRDRQRYDLPQQSSLFGLALEHFQLISFSDILPLLYPTYNKTKVATFAKVIADEAASGDELAKAVLAKAGSRLARLLSPLLNSRVGRTAEETELKVLTMGSVWKSFPLLREGMMKAFRETPREARLQWPEELILLRPHEHCGAVGSAVAASQGEMTPATVQCEEYTRICLGKSAKRRVWGVAAVLASLSVGVLAVLCSK